MISLNPSTTAPALIDLQKGILAAPLFPHESADVVKVAVDPAKRFRDAGSLVVLVKVAFAADLGDALVDDRTGAGRTCPSDVGAWTNGTSVWPRLLCNRSGEAARGDASGGVELVNGSQHVDLTSTTAKPGLPRRPLAAAPPRLHSNQGHPLDSFRPQTDIR